jgi:tRNA(Arg) A34 adenosine deaminase TadA
VTIEPRPNDDALLSRVFAIADEARARGNHPFGALLAVAGVIVAEAHNLVTTTNDITAHAETELVRTLERANRLDALSEGIVYASCEPCPMCVGALFWAGARSVVFGLTSARLNELGTAPGAQPFGFTITAATIGAAASPPLVVVGPFREHDAEIAHKGFWTTP